MAFHETRFPDDISYGSAGGPGFKTVVVSTDSGAEERVSRWGTARRQYDVSYGIKTHAQLTNLKEFYIAREGMAHGFRFKDFHDFTTSDDGMSTPGNDEELGTGDGSTKVFQLKKRYISGPSSRVRTITKPVSGTTVVYLDGVDQGAEGSGWSVNTATGEITFNTAPGGGVVVSAGCEFDVPVRFGEMPDEVMTLNYESFSTGGIPSVPLVEIIDNVSTEDEFYYGGALRVTMSANYQSAMSQGRVYRLLVDTASLNFALPDLSTVPLGGPILYVYNSSTSSELVTVVAHTNDGGGTIIELPVGYIAELVCFETSPGSKSWGCVRWGV